MALPRTLGELQLYRVLQRANLLAYYQTFIQQGGDDVQQLCEAAEEEFLEIMALVGMATKPLHVRRLQKALRDWAANPGLFNQPVPGPPPGGVPLFKVEGGAAPGKALSNGRPGSPGEREERACLSPGSPGSRASPQPPDSLSPAEARWPGPEADGSCCSASGPEEEAPSPPPPPGPSASPPGPSAPAWPGGRLDGETAGAVAESVERLLRTLPRSDPAEAKTLLRMNKKMAKTVGHIFKMAAQDANKEEEIRKYSLIYGRFDSKRREGKQLTHHELIINEAAAQFCMRDNALLLRRVELFSLARQVARKCAYTSTLKHTRTSEDGGGGGCVAPHKRARHETMMPENMSSLVGADGSEASAQRAEDDGPSAGSPDGAPHDLSSHQRNQSPPPRAHADASNPNSWSRHLIQQTLMDEGLRLARMVSRERAGKAGPPSDGTRSSEHEGRAERRSSVLAAGRRGGGGVGTDSNPRGK